MITIEGKIANQPGQIDARAAALAPLHGWT
jgi:hypothetical protein